MNCPDTNDVLLSVLRERLEHHGGVRLALLFGSRARGNPSPQSDIDLAVDAPGVDQNALAAFLSQSVGAEVDVVPLADASIPLLEALVRDGIVVYQSRGQAAAWRSRVLAQLETDRPWYRRMRDAWIQRVASEGFSGGR